MIDELAEEFRARFGRAPEAGARAPGRVNLIGEHTDYNEGLVLPCAIDRSVVAWVARRDDGEVCARSREQQPEVRFSAAAPVRGGDWGDYVRGVVTALGEAGLAAPGFDLALASDVPLGSGLSSSAALGVAVVTALDALCGWGLSAERRARLAHRGETGFVCVACGIMDPFASALCRAGHALRLDCRSEAREDVALPEVALLVAHSGVQRALAEGGYGERVAECRAALAAAAPERRALRDVAEAELPELTRGLEPRLARRVRHVVGENARVDAMCEALRAGDLARAGALLRASMRSLRDDYEVSTPELDFLCESADALPGVHGSRLTGAGFGGCTLHLVDPGAADEAAAALARAFAVRFGAAPPVWRVRPAAGAEALAS